MARHARPIELAILKGETKRRPGRYSKIVPKSDLPCGDPHEGMSKEAQACWFEISSKTIPGTLTFADSIMLEIAANLLAEYKQAPNDFMIGKYTHLIGILARLGMSPADRTKIGIEKPQVIEDDFE